MILKLLITITLVVFVGADPGLRAADSRFDGLSEYIETAIGHWQTPGLAIVVYHHDQLIYSGAFGVREVGRRDRVNLDTVFAWSSNGKAFTATAAAIAVDEGKLRWDDPISWHLDYFQLPDPWVSRSVTIRDLLSHRISGDLGAGKLEIWAYTALSREEVLKGLRYLEVSDPRFRGQYQYSNPNISAAGQALGVVSGMSWEEFMKTRVLAALGMASTSTSVLELWEPGQFAPCYMCELDDTPRSEDAKIDNIAMPHVATANGPALIPWRTVDNIAPAGSINGSVLDFAKIMRLHLGRGMFEGRRIVTEESIGETHSPQVLMPDPAYPAGEGFGSLWAYGLGWYLVDYRGHKVVFHGGAITGWRSGIIMIPSEELGVAVVSNQQGPYLPSELPAALGFVVFDRVLGLKRVDRSATWLASVREGLAQAAAFEKSLQAQRQADRAANLTELAGVYLHPGFGELLIQADGTLKLADVMYGAIEHWANDRYRLTWIGPWPIPYFLQVHRGTDGKPSDLELASFGTFVRQPDQ